ncbi:MAG TPA: PIG-L family deacetylase [Candidatus Bathyarchaeia archaeon]|nr:PIG-L family deacetylase [Candidatus Bathyarchaeia archaeon]
MKENIVVFAPHPDDETFGCGGTMVKKLREGYEVFIVVMTDGRHAFLNILGVRSDPSPIELKAIRKEEVLKAVKVLGVPSENLLFFDFEDTTLGEHEAEAEEKVLKVLEKYSPVEVYFPCEKDANVDHQAANRIIKGAIEELGFSTSQYKYSIIQKFARVGPFISRLLNFFRRNLVYVDVSQYLPLKEAAIKEFKSEIEALSLRQKRPIIENSRRFLKNKEMFYR